MDTAKAGEEMKNIAFWTFAGRGTARPLILERKSKHRGRVVISPEDWAKVEDLFSDREQGHIEMRISGVNEPVTHRFRAESGEYWFEAVTG